MLAVLDPLLFGGDRPVAESQLDEAARILRQTNARIPAGFYWRKLEKSVWNLRVQVPGVELRRVPAVANRRNITVPWTTRFDEKLPAENEAAFPFCPPSDWLKSNVRAFETHQSRPAWLDAKGNHWACPATGWGYHWDVYLESRLADGYGLDQLNIVRWGAPSEEGATGSIHHVPKEKKQSLKKRTGWSC